MQRKSPFLSVIALLLTLVGAVAAHAQHPAEGQFADINGARIFYTVTGQGEPMVLIHGYPLNGNLFAKQREELSQRFQVITLDLRGFGQSVAPDERGSISIYARDVLALLDTLGIQQAIIGGHSMGGIITLEIYRRAPERFKGMLLIDPAAAPPPIVEQFLWRGYARQSRELGVESLLPLLLPEFLTGNTRQNKPEMVAAVSDLIRQASLNGLVGGARALRTRPDLTGVLPTITVPTLLLYGEEDSLTPIEQGKMLQAAIPNSELAIISNASHGAIMERAQRANNIILRWAAQTLGVRRGVTREGVEIQRLAEA